MIAKPTVNDVARVAGVSLATVDRVLNERPGVRAATIEKVNRAIAELAYVRDTAAANLARSKTYRFAFVLPDWKGQFFASLMGSIEEVAAQAHLDRTEIRTILVPNHDHTFLVRELDALGPDEIDGLAIMSKETPVVRDAIIRLRRRGISVVTLITDQLGSERDHFVGIDNVAAGRTAGMLMGRFLAGRQGKVLVVVSSRQSRDMLERRHGFDQILGEQFDHLNAQPSIEGHEDPGYTEAVVLTALDQYRDVVGIYSAGASVLGVAGAIAKHNFHGRPIFIDHELTDNSAHFIREGVLDAVITQNTGHLARSALRVLRAKCDNKPVIASQENIRIDIVIRENLPTMK
ncbi:LacI family DNA-binding transcriptional regulator [Cognatiyoonia sp. IB215446]|uniref:LacI family DNA-binding transcriptional regulator n=1 Tax=Cognatiyoonia sp. IB215446 TaxID=3097355 RepID=UPI002A0BA9CE|nr:LacI family DNA-binding transcriptional regulator [Cognatiyoonia sp. IB215446]MDX8347339.1 LacI family DNA-binding transcriptional regulator [Cognatiyoonia sp. IB215446]